MFEEYRIKKIQFEYLWGELKALPDGEEKEAEYDELMKVIEDLSAELDNIERELWGE